MATRAKRKPAPPPEPEVIFRGAPTAPARGTTTLSWGLVTAPVSFHNGVQTDAVGVKRHQWTPDGHEVGSQPYDKMTGEPVDRSIILKKVEASDGTLVELTDDEIELHSTGTKGIAPIETFIPLSTLGRDYVVTAANFVRPAKRGTGRDKKDDPAAIKAYGLLMDAMATSGVAALVRIANKGPAKWAAITPDGMCLTLAFASELRGAPEVPVPTHTTAELAMGRQLIDQVGVSTPTLVDDVTGKLLDYVEAKAAGTAPTVIEMPTPAPSVDLMAALEASLAS